MLCESSDDNEQLETISKFSLKENINQMLQPISSAEANLVNTADLKLHSSHQAFREASEYSKILAYLL